MWVLNWNITLQVFHPWCWAQSKIQDISIQEHLTIEPRLSKSLNTYLNLLAQVVLMWHSYGIITQAWRYIRCTRREPRGRGMSLASCMLNMQVNSREVRWLVWWPLKIHVALKTPSRRMTPILGRRHIQDDMLVWSHRANLVSLWMIKYLFMSLYQRSFAPFVIQRDYATYNYYDVQTIHTIL